MGRFLPLAVALLMAEAVVPNKRPPTREERHAQLKAANELHEKLDDLDAKRQKASWTGQNKGLNVSLPPHIVANAQRSVDQWFAELHLSKTSQACGQKLPAATLGLKPSLLATVQHPGQNSWAQPGSGVEQVVKDEGRSISGTMDGEEPYVTVLKDGFFEVGCYTDGMLEFADKFGNNKDKYKGESTNVSIVLYKELVLEEKAKPMTPVVCFEFCRTLKNMVFFGISNGNECYCTPYYKQAAGDGKQCDVPCEGDPTQMCGNKAKSSIWEMHLCDNTAEELKAAMVKAKEALDFYFEDAVMAGTIGSQMTRSGIALEKVAGQSGAPAAADNGMAAKVAAKTLSQAYQPGLKTYQELLTAYSDATALKGADFGKPAFAAAAEKAIREMKAATGPVKEVAAAIHKTVKLSYPPLDKATFGDDPDPEDTMAVMLAEDGMAEGFDFRPFSYALDTNFKSDSSSCTGPVIGPPLVGLGLPDCAKVCEATVAPVKCKAFSFYGVQESAKVDGKGLSDLCFLLDDVMVLETFQCPASLAQEKTLRGSAAAHDEAWSSAECFVKMSEVSTGYKPSPLFKWSKANRCFKTEKEDAVKVPDAFQTFKMPEVAKMEGEGKDVIAAPP